MNMNMAAVLSVLSVLLLLMGPADGRTCQDIKAELAVAESEWGIKQQAPVSGSAYILMRNHRTLMPHNSLACSAAGLQGCCAACKQLLRLQQLQLGSVAAAAAAAVAVACTVAEHVGHPVQCGSCPYKCKLPCD